MLQQTKQLLMGACHLTTCSRDTRCHANQPLCSYRCIPLHLPSSVHTLLHWSSERSDRWCPHSWQHSHRQCTGSQHLCGRPPQTRTRSQSTLHKGRGRAANKTFWNFECEATDGYAYVVLRGQTLPCFCCCTMFCNSGSGG